LWSLALQLGKCKFCGPPTVAESQLCIVRVVDVVGRQLYRCADGLLAYGVAGNQKEATYEKGEMTANDISVAFLKI